MSAAIYAPRTRDDWISTIGLVVGVGLFIMALMADCAAPSPAFAQTRVPACDVDYALFSRDTLWVYVELRKPPGRICVLDLSARKTK